MMGNRGVQHRATVVTAVERLLPESQESRFQSKLCDTLDKSLYLSEPHLPGGPHRDTLPSSSGGII